MPALVQDDLQVHHQIHARQHQREDEQIGAKALELGCVHIAQDQDAAEAAYQHIQKHHQNTAPGGFFLILHRNPSVMCSVTV